MNYQELLDLDDWLLDAGTAVEQKAIRGEGLSPLEALIREMWVLDCESLNGGVCQYFGNHGIHRWKALLTALKHLHVESVEALTNAISATIANAEDPYEAAAEASNSLNEFYYTNRSRAIENLRALQSAA
jgi:hypothetical protein